MITHNHNYNFRETLHEDIKLEDVRGNGHWDMLFENGDVVQATDDGSLVNACLIALMTRYHELQTNPLYEGFGCRVHENIKKNKTSLLSRIIESQTMEVLSKMRRIKKVNWITVEDDQEYNYIIHFSVTSLTDKIVESKVRI